MQSHGEKSSDTINDQIAISVLSYVPHGCYHFFFFFRKIYSIGSRRWSFVTTFLLGYVTEFLGIFNDCRKVNYELKIVSNLALVIVTFKRILKASRSGRRSCEPKKYAF